MPVFLGKENVTQATGFDALSRFGDVAGKRVLEVGGNSDCVAASYFAANGASEVLVTGLYHVDENHVPPLPNIRLDSADALKLSETYAEGSFDFLYGISILEHIPAPDLFFAQVRNVLSTGGLAFLQGNPVWTGPWGHHIHLTPWQDGTTGCYQFYPAQALLDQGVHTFNPIPDWGHLLFTPDELAAHLAGLAVPAEDIPKVLAGVYTDDVISREPAHAIVDAAAKSGLKILELEFDRVELPAEIRDRLRQLRASPKDDHSISGIRMVLQKV